MAHGESVGLPNALVQLQARYHHCDEVAPEKCLSAATIVSWRCEDLCIKELLDRYFDVAADLSKQRRRDISTRMHRYRRDASIRVAELFVRTSLPDFYEPDPLQPRDDFPRLLEPGLSSLSKRRGSSGFR
jgi:hypothetical protein